MSRRWLGLLLLVIHADLMAAETVEPAESGAAAWADAMYLQGCIGTTARNTKAHPGSPESR